MRLRDIREDRAITQREIAAFFDTSTDYILRLTNEDKPYSGIGTNQ